MSQQRERLKSLGPYMSEMVNKEQIGACEGLNVLEEEVYLVQNRQKGRFIYFPPFLIHLIIFS